MVFKNLGQDLLETIIKPSQCFHRIAETRNIWQGIIMHVIIYLLITFAVVQSITTEGLIDFFANLGLPFHQELAESVIDTLPSFSLITQVIFGTLLFCVWLAIVNLCAELFNGEGDGNRLGSAFGFATLPLVFLVPAAFLLSYMPLIVFLALAAALFLWSQILKIIGVKEAHVLTPGQALISYFLPVVTLLIALLMFALLSVAFLLPFIVEFLDSLARTF